MTHYQQVTQNYREKFLKAMFLKESFVGTDSYLAFYIDTQTDVEYNFIARKYIPTSYFTFENVDDGTATVYNNTSIYIGPLPTDVAIGGYQLWSASSGGTLFLVFPLLEVFNAQIDTHIKIPVNGIKIDVSI